MSTVAALITIVLAIAAVILVWRPPSTLSRHLGAGAPHAPALRATVTAVAGATALAAAVVVASGTHDDTNVAYAIDALRPSVLGQDSWAPMLTAAQELEAHSGSDIYEAVFFEGGVKFQYPVMSLVLAAPLLTALEWTDQQVFDAANAACWVCFLLLGGTVGLIFLRALARATSRSAPYSWPARLCAIAGGTAATFLYFPVTRGLELGQIQTAMTLAAALALLAWQHDRPWIAGALIGLCCVVKPHWGILVLWALLRGRWQFAAGAAAVAVPLTIVSVAVYGFDNVIAYVDVARALSVSGESYFPNQSFNGLANRFFDNGPNLVFDPIGLPSEHAGVRTITLVTTVAILGACLAWRTQRPPTAVELSLVMVSLTIAAPVAWEHHYGVLLPVFAAAAPAIARRRPWGRASVPLLAFAYALTSVTLFPIVNRTAETPANVLQSYMLAGGLLLLVTLYRLSWVERRGYGLAGRPPMPVTSSPSSASPLLR